MENHLTFGSLFTGIGGLDLGFERAGMVCKWQVEIDDYCNRVLEKHWPDVRRYRDVKEVGSHNLEPVDVIVGGFPCQDVSTSGKKKGIKEGTGSGLWFEFARIISDIKPRWIVVENVRGLLSIDNGGGFGIVLRDLAQMGYDAEWGLLPTGAFIGSHLRYRVFLVAYPSSNGWMEGTVFQKGNIEQSITGGAKPSYLSDKAAWHSNGSVTSDLRGSNGISSELDIARIKALGNAVVPQVAEFIAGAIVEANDTARIAQTVSKYGLYPCDTVPKARVR